MNEVFQETFGAIVARKRKALNISQGQLAIIFKASPQTIGNVEKGRSSISFEKASRFCKLLGIKIDVMLSEVNVDDEKKRLSIEISGGVKEIDRNIKEYKAALEKLEAQKRLINRLESRSNGYDN